MTSNDLKPGWQTLKFEDFAENIAVRVSPSKADTDIYVGLEHLDPETIHLRSWGHPSDVDGDKLRFKKGDVIFGRRRAYQRKLAVAEFDGICSAHAMVVRAKPKMMLPEFLPFFLYSDMFMERAIEISVGSLSPTINWKTLKVQKFAVPPIDEQKRLSEVLWAADNVVEKFLCTKSNLKETMISTFKNLVITSKPDTKRISELGNVITGNTPPTKNPEYYNEHEFMFVSPADIGADKYVRNTEKMVSTSGFNTGRKISKNAVMVVCIGSTTGKVAMASEQCITNQQINTLVCNENTHPDFVYRTFKMMEDFFYRQASCTALPILNKSQFSSIEVLMPSIDAQRRIVEKINIIENVESNLDEHIENTRVILRQLIKGGFDNV